MLEGPIEIRKALKPAREAGRGDAFPGQEHLLGLVDAIVVDELGESKARHFLKVSAKCSRTQVAQLSDLLNGDSTRVVLIYKAVNAIQPRLIS